MLKRHNKNSNSLRQKSYSVPRKTYSQKISCFSIARVCCKLSGVCLLLLAFLLINPTVTSANALEPEEDADPNDQISAQADSGVTISFSPSSGSASLTPTTSDGASAKINVSANINIASTGGYTIYLGGKNAALTGEKTGQTIPGATTATTFSNMKTNTWGYAVAEGSSVPDTATYATLPQGQGVTLKSVSGNNSNVSHNYAISFATRIGNDKPADVYSNQVTLSVTSSPLQVTTLSTIVNMQDMTTRICSDSKVGETKQLIDARDGKKYWVKKMPDNKCWMVQNLALDLGTTWPDASKSDFTTANTTYRPVATAAVASSTTIDASNTATRSWNLDDYVITNPTSASACGAAKSGFINCPAQYTSVSGKMASSDPNFYKSNSNKTVVGNEYDAHYLVGNHYQWNAATAGTGGTLTSGQASGSICPKNWRLPTVTGANEFQNLLTAASIGTSVATLTGDGYFFVRAGDVNQNATLLLENAAVAGFYWSSSPGPSNANAYSLYFHDATGLEPSIAFNRSSGFSVRCIAR